jgi:RimJ/RimL family protein N-acetyltransferase
MLSAPEVGAFKGFSLGATREQCWAGLANILGHWILRGYGLFAVERVDDGAFIGTVGVIEPLGWPGPEISWTVTRQEWGQGYASEAALAVRGWASGSIGLSSLVSLIHANNTASIRVARKIGGSRTDSIMHFGERVGLFRYG